MISRFIIVFDRLNLLEASSATIAFVWKQISSLFHLNSSNPLFFSMQLYILIVFFFRPWSALSVPVHFNRLSHSTSLSITHATNLDSFHIDIDHPATNSRHAFVFDPGQRSILWFALILIDWYFFSYPILYRNPLTIVFSSYRIILSQSSPPPPICSFATVITQSNSPTQTSVFVLIFLSLAISLSKSLWDALSFFFLLAYVSVPFSLCLILSLALCLYCFLSLCHHLSAAFSMNLFLALPSPCCFTCFPALRSPLT